jgi:toxin ParE1/3/4
MAYEVRVSKKALANLRHIYQAIRVIHSPLAEDWFLGLEAAIFSLENLPQRNPVTPERADLRHLMYGDKPRSYRILYAIDEAKLIVHVVQIRHWARGPMRSSK